MKDIYRQLALEQHVFELHRLICKFVSIVNTIVLYEQRLVGISDMEELSMCRAVYKLCSEDVIWLHGGWASLPPTQGSGVFVFVSLPVWKLLAVSVPLPSLRISFGNTGIFHYILLHFIVLFCCCCFILFFKLSLWQLCLEQVYWCHFSNGICLLFLSASHFGNSWNI